MRKKLFGHWGHTGCVDVQTSGEGGKQKPLSFPARVTWRLSDTRASQSRPHTDSTTLKRRLLGCFFFLFSSKPGLMAALGMWPVTQWAFLEVQKKQKAGHQWGPFGKETGVWKTAEIPETNIHPRLFCQGNVTNCSWNAECLRMSFFLPWLCLFHTSCLLSQYVLGVCACVCVFIPHPFPLSSCSLIRSDLDRLNMLSHTNIDLL